MSLIITYAYDKSMMNEEEKETSSSKIKDNNTILDDSDSKEQKRKKATKKAIIFSSIGACVAIGLGTYLGVFLASIFNTSNTYDYSNIDTSKYAVNYDELLKKYDALEQNTTLYESTFSEVEMVNVSLALFARHQNWMCQGYGVGNAIIGPIKVAQDIRSTMIRCESDYFEESLSKSSVIQAAARMYQRSGDENTYKYVGSVPNSVEIAVFDEEASPSKYSPDEYLTYAGRNLTDVPNIYIISEKTLASSSQPTLSALALKERIFDTVSKTYTINLELDYRKSVVNYVKQMRATTEMKSDPVFDYIHLEFTMDENLNLIKSKSTERYFASTPSGSSYVEGELVTYYATDGGYSLPELNSPLAYDFE